MCNLAYRPHICKERRIFETVNDCFFLFGTYHLILYSDFVTNPEVQSTAGLSFYIFIAVLMGLYLVKITKDFV
jgi:hypothetical protein